MRSTRQTDEITRQNSTDNGTVLAPTDTRAIIQRMTRDLSNDEQRLASIDGKTGRGGCEECDATYEIIYAGHGIGHMRITHQRTCPVIIAKWRRSLGAFLTNRDTGDEQQ